jgi:hypothetical protein
MDASVHVAEERLDCRSRFRFCSSTSVTPEIGALLSTLTPIRLR